MLIQFIKKQYYHSYIFITNNVTTVSSSLEIIAGVFLGQFFLLSGDKIVNLKRSRRNSIRPDALRPSLEPFG